MRTRAVAAWLTVTTLSLAACGGEEPAPQAPPPPPPPPVDTAPVATATEPPPPVLPPKPALADLIKESMRALRDGFNAHDPAKMAAAVTDDVAVFDYGVGETHSKAEFQSGMAMLFSAFSDAKYVTNRIFIKDHVVISEGTWVGTMTSDVMGIKATQKPVGQMRLNVYWVNDDGLVKEVHEYADEAGFLAQLQGKKGAPPVPVLPTNPPEVHVSTGTPEEDKLASWVKGTDDGFNKDAKAAAAEMADDADYWLAVTGQPATKGKKNLTKELVGWFKTFPDQQWTTTNAWGIDGFGIIEHTMTGTFKGPFGPVRPTGKKITGWHNIDIIQPSADGKIQHGWGYANSLEMLGQAGARPATKHGDKAAAQPPATGSAKGM